YASEPDSLRDADVSFIDLQDEIPLGEDIKLHMLLDRLNLILAQGRISATGLSEIESVLLKYEGEDNNDFEKRVRLAIYLVLASPEYLITR
ncbi:MAG: hypothetical protein AAGK97_14745, partial [Bacteroidota bacterium]